MIHTRLTSIILAGAVGVAGIVLVGCQDGLNTGSGTAIGAATGALIGAIANDDEDRDEIWKGAAIGAGVGALAGRAARAKRYKSAGGYPASGTSYPTGTATSNPNYVKSPYSPYNVIDVTGFRSGELAVDPTSDQVFRVP